MANSFKGGSTAQPLNTSPSLKTRYTQCAPGPDMPNMHTSIE